MELTPVDRIPTTMSLKLASGIELSQFEFGDADDCVEYLNDEEIFRFTRRIPHPYTRQDALDWLSLAARSSDDHGTPLHYVIRRPPQRLLGAIGLVELKPPISAEVGYWLGRPFRGQGVMSAVVPAFCDWALREFGLELLVAHVFDTNVASMRVLEKSGFRRFGHVRHHTEKRGKSVSAWRYEFARQ